MKGLIAAIALLGAISLPVDAVPRQPREVEDAFGTFMLGYHTALPMGIDSYDFHVILGRGYKVCNLLEQDGDDYRMIIAELKEQDHYEDADFVLASVLYLCPQLRGE